MPGIFLTDFDTHSFSDAYLRNDGRLRESPRTTYSSLALVTMGNLGERACGSDQFDRFGPKNAKRWRSGWIQADPIQGLVLKAVVEAAQPREVLGAEDWRRLAEADAALLNRLKTGLGYRQQRSTGGARL